MEEPAGFRTGHCSVEQNNSSINKLKEKYGANKHIMYLTFVDPKHAFDTVWISAHWRIMKKHIIEAAVSSVIDVLSDNIP